MTRLRRTFKELVREIEVTEKATALLDSLPVCQEYCTPKCIEPATYQNDDYESGVDTAYRCEAHRIDPKHDELVPWAETAADLRAVIAGRGAK